MTAAKGKTIVKSLVHKSIYMVNPPGADRP